MLISTGQQSGKVDPGIYIAFHILFNYGLITGYWIEFPVPYSRTLQFIHSISNSWRLLTPNSQACPPPPLCLWQPQVCSLCLWVSFLFRRGCNLRLSWNSNSDLYDADDNRKNNLHLVMTEVIAMPWALHALANSCPAQSYSAGTNTSPGTEGNSTDWHIACEWWSQNSNHTCLS